MFLIIKRRTAPQQLRSKGLAGDLKISTAPQRERFDTWDVNNKFVRTTKKQQRTCQTMKEVVPLSQPFFRTCKVLCLTQKLTRGIQSPTPATLKSSCAMLEPFKTSSTFTKYCVCHTKLPPKALLNWHGLTPPLSDVLHLSRYRTFQNMAFHVKNQTAHPW